VNRFLWLPDSPAQDHCTGRLCVEGSKESLRRSMPPDRPGKDRRRNDHCERGEHDVVSPGSKMMGAERQKQDQGDRNTDQPQQGRTHIRLH